MNTLTKLYLEILTSEGEITYSSGWEGMHPRYSITLDKNAQLRIYCSTSWWKPFITIEAYIDGYYKSDYAEFTKKQAREIRKHLMVQYKIQTEKARALREKLAEQNKKPNPIDVFLTERYRDRTVSDPAVVSSPYVVIYE